MRVQFEQVKVLQDYESLALIVSMAFGGKSRSSSPFEEHEPPPRPDQVGETTTNLVPKNFEDLMTGFRATMGVANG